MTRESKVLLAVIVLCTLALAAFQYALATRVMGVNLLATQSVTKDVQEVKMSLPSLHPVEATDAASPSAIVKGKATATPKATVKATATPEAEATPAE